MNARLKPGPVTLFQNYVPCDECTEKIQNSLSGYSRKISGLCIKYWHPYKNKDQKTHVQFIYLLLPIDGVDFTVAVTRFSKSPLDHVDHIWLRRDLEDLFLKMDPYRCNRLFNYDSAVYQSNLQDSDVHSDLDVEE